MEPEELTEMWLDASEACYTDVEHEDGRITTRINPSRETAELFIKAREASRSLPEYEDMDEGRGEIEEIFERFSDCFSSGFPTGLEQEMEDVRQFMKAWLCHAWQND